MFGFLTKICSLSPLRKLRVTGLLPLVLVCGPVRYFDVYAYSATTLSDSPRADLSKQEALVEQAAVGQTALANRQWAVNYKYGLVRLVEQVAKWKEGESKGEALGKKAGLTRGSTGAR